MSGSNAPPLLTVSSNGIGVVPDALLNTFVQGSAVVATLRAFVGLTNMQVWLIGTATANDGGQGMFYWNSASITTDDNGATTIQPNGIVRGRWLRQSGAVSSIGAVANIAALRALTTAASPVWVEGYYAPGDGGEGMFVLGATASDNGGTIILSGDGTYYRETQGLPWPVKWFGAKIDGTTNDFPAWQNAIGAAETAQAKLTWPGGSSVIDAALGITGAVTIQGAGKTISKLLLSTNNMTGVSITGTAPVTLADFEITPNSGVTGTTAIGVSPGSGVNSESLFLNLQILGCVTGINFQAAAGWTVDKCNISNFTSVGVIVRDTSNADDGDSTITSCYIQGASTSASACIQQQSSGGLKIVGNKLLTATYGYILELDNGANTGALVITGNSIEDMATSGIVLSQSTSSGSFVGAVISGNEFNIMPEGIGVTMVTQGWISNIAITGNSIELPANGIGIHINGATGFTIGGNNFLTGSSNVGCIQIDSAASNGEILRNGYVGAASYCDNLSTSTIVEPSIQNGTATAETVTAYGSLFSSNGVAVSFPVPYITAPAVTITATAGSGATAGLAESITPTGFTLVGIGVNNSAMLTFNWSASGS